MDFVAVLDQVSTLLRQRWRVAYRTLKRQFQLDDEALEDLKIELIDASHLAGDEHASILVSLLDHQLPFLDPGHELDTDEGGLGCLERFAPEPGSWDPLHSALVLLHEMMELWDLAHADGRAVRLVVALDGRFLGRAAGARAR